MSIQLREARRSLSEPDAVPSHSAAMVRLFAEINRSASPMLGVIALGVCATALAWVDAGPLVTWITFIACAIAIGYALPIAFLDSSEKEKPPARGDASSCSPPRSAARPGPTSSSCC